MAREIDEAWIEEAVERHRRLESLRAQLDEAAAGTRVTVRSPDGSVEVVVTAAGAIVDVHILGSLQRRTNDDVSRSVRQAVVAAADAARWARAKLHDEVFSAYLPLAGR
ncbi:YbaB/EbfC family nucleoid-associated protein [Spirilliplanes yamanashiensis]|uniref:YbaB/EbfC DNA-binding family protein n=1 Tax=Spirilliplanes yamanashiensis TaxID=42233 RepID=A0A8J4DJ29_9ACTN|nr:YbaB/EbfC family nucleoid-associated protein [Spirilliplanes yamanashiensis]MDP9815478.1 DNA-binding protein YbaB [Spirilliplanes yamanashiensis]GIJ03732.1 hypothetical protein Sya03_30840 [Spirilliplanes yamanashiensis]